jgi:hypothetical protein
MKRQNKLTPQEQEQQALGHQQTKESVLEFATPEELLRHDAVHTVVPPTIAHRLKESIGGTPSPTRSWWRRLLGQ